MVDTSKMVFVFGSNEAGIHGAGAARYAHEKRGATLGQGYGHLNGHHRYSSNGSFAIPTKDRHIARTLPLPVIQQYVDGFLAYAFGRPDLEFQVTQIGCGLAGLKPQHIAPMFLAAPSNCWFDTGWEPHLTKTAKFWGTF